MEVNYADVSHSSLKLVLNFKEVITVNELVLQLLEVGRILENQFVSETDEDKKKIITEQILFVLKNDREIINKEISLYDPECPVDDIKIRIYQQGLAIIDTFEKYINGEIEKELIRTLIEELYKTMEQMHEILDKYSSELKILAIASTLLDTGWNIRGIVSVNDEDINEKKIDKDKLTEFLEDCIKKIDIEKKNLSHSADKLLIDAIDFNDKAVKSYIEALKEDEVNIVIIDTGLDNIRKSVEKITEYQGKLYKSKKLGIGEYLVAFGKEIKLAIKLNEESSKELEKYFSKVLENLMADKKSMEEKKKSYITKNDEYGKELIEDASSPVKPVNDIMIEVYDKSVDVINNYISFIKGDRNIDLINDALKLSIYINYLLDESDKMVKDLQSMLPHKQTVIGEA